MPVIDAIEASYGEFAWFTEMTPSQEPRALPTVNDYPLFSWEANMVLIANNEPQIKLTITWRIQNFQNGLTGLAQIQTHCQL